jgi:hypothetical protein
MKWQGRIVTDPAYLTSQVVRYWTEGEDED